MLGGKKAEFPTTYSVGIYVCYFYTNWTGSQVHHETCLIYTMTGILSASELACSIRCSAPEWQGHLPPLQLRVGSCVQAKSMVGEERNLPVRGTFLSKSWRLRTPRTHWEVSWEAGWPEQGFYPTEWKTTVQKGTWVPATEAPGGH